MATQVEVAEHLRLTERQLRRLQKLPGAPVSKKRGDLDIDEWRYFYLSYLQRNRNSRTDEESEDDDHEEKLLVARIELTSEQAIAQRLKNQVAEHKVIDTVFCVFALSRLAGELASVLDSIPLSMQRQFPELNDRQLAYLKELVAKGANKCVESAERMQEFADEYYRNTDE
ncbi:terminase small subunit [Citrobacter amalonaticus]|uniref:terminase small subunit n=1 Tax=Citrobacter amalonaticus TaxID=35703 RepID=UPI0016505245|nr:terminase small subunit [Citrobacter amalonaticus]HEF0022603.1 terminase small subunit [Citrobacter amalonaticus]